MPNHVKVKIVIAMFAVFVISAILIEINALLGLFFLLFGSGFLSIVVSIRVFSSSYVLLYDPSSGEFYYDNVVPGDYDEC